MQRQPIDERQRDRRSAQLLRAFSAEYRRAKLFRALHLGVSFALVLAGPLFSLVSLEAAAGVGALAGVWVMVTRLVLIPMENAHVRCAARIQELFDTRLFDLEWPEGLAGAQPSEEDIADAARRVKEDERLSRQIDEGWYPSTEDVPWPVNVLLAQWSSVAYGRHQSVAYFRFLAASTATVSLGVIAIGIAAGMPLSEWLITFALPSLPGLLDVSEVADAHRRLTDNKASVERDLLQPLWRAELTERGVLRPEDCRRVQDHAFRARLKGLQVPEWFFWLRRSRSEANMHEACANRRSELGLPNPH